jgi:PucR family transcriptional regulator, purine catabolism regulatory protein
MARKSMLTVENALQLEPLTDARVVAGHPGLNREVAWVHIASGADAPLWVNGGELVLTTASNLPDTPEDQRQYLRDMAEKDVAGLIVTVGRMIDHAPAHLIELADILAFPLIEIPYQARFVDIAKSTNERIAQERMGLVTRALSINRVLTQLVLDGGDLKQLASTLAGLIGQSISIENERFEALASANIAAVDEARRYTLSQGRTDPRLVQALHDRGVIGEICRTLRPVFIDSMADVGLEMERILAPIVVHGDIYGYMWIIANDRPLSDLDHMAIESGATIAALMMLHQEAVQSAEASLKGSLLAQLIEGDTEREVVLTDQALRYGLDLSAPFVMLLVDSADRSTARLLQIYRRINRIAPTRNWNAVVGQFAGQVVILTHADENLETMSEAILSQLNGETRISISARQRGAGQVGKAYHQCRDGLYIAGRLRDGQQTIYFSDLGYLHALYQAGAETLENNPYIPGLRKLLDEQQADLFNTLETYLDNGANGVRTAELLHIYRSTLNYRLDRIKEVCGLDLADPVARTNLQVALKLLRLFEV